MNVLASLLDLRALVWGISLPQFHEDAVHSDTTNFECLGLPNVGHSTEDRYNLSHLVAKIHDNAVHA